MKKSLVLAMAMALGVTASAYAANPFSDVPAGHWAYDSIDKLAAAGVIDGMGDGSFQGDKTMTRYEMAQIVAKAMAKGANVDKLAAEFADELDALGVRVAALEKKADNVTITGQVRWDYAHRQNRGGEYKNGTKEVNRLRTRLFLDGQINEDWAYHARLENTETIDNAVSENTFDMNRAWVTGRLGGLKVIAGKAPIVIADGNLFDNTMERVEVAYGKNVQVSAFVGNGDATGTNDDIWGAKIATKAGKLSLAAEYTSFKDENKKNIGKKSVGLNDAGDDVVVKPAEAVKSLYERDNAIYDVVVKYQFDKNIGLNYTYLNADAKGAADGIANVIGIDYKGANAKKPGSWGLWAKYYNMGADVITGNATMNIAGDMATVASDTGFQGYGIGLSYALAKNITAYTEYYNLDEKESSKSMNTIFTRLQFAF